MTWFSDSLVIAWRDILKGLRERSRLLGAVVRAIIWLFVLGSGLRPVVQSVGGDYLAFLFPGIIIMNVLFSGVMSGTSIIWDREFGFLKEILVAPVSRTSIILGKTLGGTLLATFHGCMVLCLFPFVGGNFSALQLLGALPGMFLTAFAVTALGMLIATRMRSFDGFGTINNFVVMPLFFLSGAMYPVDRVPSWIGTLTRLDPVHYGVDLVRGAMFSHLTLTQTAFDVGALAGFSALFLIPAVLLFGGE